MSQCQKPSAVGMQRPQGFQRRIVVGCKYLLYLPPGYGKRGVRWPLILFLHGAGERGDDLELVKRHGPPRLVSEGRAFPFIIASPQCPAERWWSNAVLATLLDELEDKCAVDPDRIYLTGLSMGGFGTWSLAAEFPERFAAIAPICGGGRPLLAARLRNVPVWAFHGSMDDVIPVRESMLMVEAVNRAGGNARLTVYPDAGHDSWTLTYAQPRLFEWFLEHRRAKAAPPRRRPARTP